MTRTTAIQYGLSGSITREFSPSYTVGQLLADNTILAQIGAPENCQAVSRGETLSSTELVSQFSSITLERRSGGKG